MATQSETTRPDFLSGGGELAELIRGRDWSTTSLGPVAQWPQSLKTTVSLMLNSRHPMWVGWGPDAVFLYNDAYISVLSAAKHPEALGRPASAVWAEIWEVCGPLADKVFRHGEASFQDDVRLFMNRSTFVEEVFYSFSYSPIRDESGEVKGLFCPSAETTGQVLGRRRLGTLSALASEASAQQSVEAACRCAMAVLCENRDDLPFVLLFLPDKEGRLQLRGSCHIDEAAPHLGAAATWQAHGVFGNGTTATLAVPAVAGLPIGLANQPVQQVQVLPVASAPGEAPQGVLVVGASPARPLDADYAAFFRLVASQLASCLQGARAAQETRTRAEQLAALDRAKTAFFSNVSHEFRTPLTLMLGPLEELLGSEPAPARRDTLRLALRNGRRLQKLVNTLLDYASIEAGKTRASFRPTDFGQLSADLASSFRAAMDKAGLHYAVHAEPLDAPVYLDARLWEKVVLNLLSNAFKFTLVGSVTVRTFEDQGQAVLQVEDTGSGIPAAELPRLFERFHRVEGTPGRSVEGSGIGLALVQELVALHGGSIEVASTVGTGTRFVVRLPFGSAHLPPAQVREDDAEAAGAPPASTYVEEAFGWLDPSGGDAIDDAGADMATPPRAPRGARILLADDNADMRGYIARLLRAQGHEVVAVGDGEQAWQHLQAGAADLLITDVMMPGMDGFALLGAVRQRPGDAALLPVIMLSARAGEEARIEGLQAGADDYLVKPFSAAELSARVASTLAIAQVRQEAAATDRRLRQEMENILESIKEGFFALDPQWRFTYVNGEAERLTGARRAELLGRTHWEVYPATLGTEVDQQFQRVMLERQAAHFQNYYAPWRRWFEISCYPVTDGGIVVYYRDITEHKAAEALARETARRKDEFLAVLAHELRNPLAPIRTGLHLLQRRPDGAITEKTLGMMDRQIAHMVRLIDDLMDVSRISRGRLELRMAPHLLRDVVESALETSRPLLDAGRHALAVSLPDEPLWLHADATRIAQTLSNVLNNAAKYTPAGGRVTLTAQRQAEAVRIAVQDTGVGITAELLPFVFDMFMQGKNTLGRAQGGIGIGLTLARQVVQLHGGSVTAASDGPGAGSTFIILLPLAPATVGATA